MNEIVYDVIDINKKHELRNGSGYIKLTLYSGFSIEREYLNGFRNGKGKEYINGKLFLEREYLNGERDGKVKKYDKDVKLEFEREYLNGERNGKGKEYLNGGLIFEGEYLYNYKIKGKEYLHGQLEYEGGYLNSKKWNWKGYDENGNIIYELSIIYDKTIFFI